MATYEHYPLNPVGMKNTYYGGDKDWTWRAFEMPSLGYGTGFIEKANDQTIRERIEAAGKEDSAADGYEYERHGQRLMVKVGSHADIELGQIQKELSEYGVLDSDLHSQMESEYVHETITDAIKSADAEDLPVDTLAVIFEHFDELAYNNGVDDFYCDRYDVLHFLITEGLPLPEDALVEYADYVSRERHQRDTLSGMYWAHVDCDYKKPVIELPAPPPYLPPAAQMCFAGIEDPRKDLTNNV